jgi:uncharacterized membrane protein YcaP (DUF421 family)
MLAAIAVRTAIVLLALVVGVRVFGRRHAGEMNVYDLLLVLMTANAVQNAMTKANGHLAVALVSAGALLALGWLCGALTARRPALQARLLGSPTILVHDGRLVWPNLKREELTEREVMTELRKRGLTELDAVKLAVLEIDGSLSVVPKEHSAGEGGGGHER